MKAEQARIAASQLEYRRAAELFAEAATAEGMEAPLQWEYRNQQALMLAEYGREHKDNEALEQAIGLYEKTVLSLAPKEDRPEDWATTQHHLGNALGVLGQRHRAPRILQRAAMAFENALSVRNQDQAPLEWATSRDNLGNG